MGGGFPRSAAPLLFGGIWWPWPPRGILFRMPELAFRPATENDLAAFRALHMEVYGRAPSEEHLKWKFFAPLSYYVGPRLFVADLGGRICASMAAMVYPFWCEGRQTLAASVMNYMTATEWRRHGLALKIHTMFCEILRENGVSSIFGMPNELTTLLFRATDQRPLFATPWVRRRVGILTVLRNRAAEKAPTLTVDATDSEGILLAEAGWQRLRGEVANCSVPTEEWLRHRYVEAPDKRYRFHFALGADNTPCGMMITGERPFSGRAESVIAYLLVRSHDNEALAALTAAAARDARRAGLSGVRTVVGASPQQMARWQGVHFRTATGAFLLHGSDEGRALAASLQHADTFLPCLGDHDFV